MKTNLTFDLWLANTATCEKVSSDLVELDSSSVSLLQVKVGFGAALGRHSITTRPFLGARTLFSGLGSNVGAQAKEGQCGLKPLPLNE